MNSPLNPVVFCLMAFEVILFLGFILSNVVANVHYAKFKKILRTSGSQILGNWVTQGPFFDPFLRPIRMYIYLFKRSYREEENFEVRRYGRLCFVDLIVFFVLILLMIILGFAIVIINKHFSR